MTDGSVSICPDHETMIMTLYAAAQYLHVPGAVPGTTAIGVAGPVNADRTFYLMHRGRAPFKRPASKQLSRLHKPFQN